MSAGHRSRPRSTTDAITAPADASLPVPRFDHRLRDLLRERLDHFDRRQRPSSGLKRSAVALVVVADDTPTDRQPPEATVILTRRAAHLPRHAGQFALPGGRLDPGETAVAAALRELDEEVALRATPDAVLGSLDDYVTRSGYHITPVVVWGEGLGEPCPEPSEVATVHRVALADLGDPERRHLIPADDGEHPVLSLALVDTLVFAPTAALLLQLGELARGRTTRVEHFEEPRFAWS